MFKTFWGRSGKANWDIQKAIYLETVGFTPSEFHWNPFKSFWNLPNPRACITSTSFLFRNENPSLIFRHPFHSSLIHVKWSDHVFSSSKHPKITLKLKLNRQTKLCWWERIVWRNIGKFIFYQLQKKEKFPKFSFCLEGNFHRRRKAAMQKAFWRLNASTPHLEAKLNVISTRLSCLPLCLKYWNFYRFTLMFQVFPLCRKPLNPFVSSTFETGELLKAWRPSSIRKRLMIDHELDGARAMFGIVLTSICSSLVRSVGNGNVCEQAREIRILNQSSCRFALSATYEYD